jgi:hypothetical protein
VAVGLNRLDQWIQRRFRSEKARNAAEIVIALLMLSPIFALLIGGCYLVQQSTCEHLSITWKNSGDYVSQRSINSTEKTDLWLDEDTGSKLVVGSAEADAQRAYTDVIAFAQDLAPLSEADRKKVERYAGKLLRSSGCD